MSASSTDYRPGLALYAKVVVAAVFILIFLGALVTSWDAGMAVPDWPLSNGSLNPNGWWNDFPTRLEHGHRLVASLVGVLTLYLTGWVWRNRWIAWASALIVLGLIYSFVAGPQHAARSASHTLYASLWVGGFVTLVVALVTGVLLKTSPPAREAERTVRWLAWAAFVAVCLQATLGGLRVTGQTAGLEPLALAFRILHGCVAQGYLILVVALAFHLSFREATGGTDTAPAKLRRFAWVTCGAIYLQLIIGAVMRHLRAGLAIPTFPEASPTGSFLPADHNIFVDSNFTHTRIGSILITLMIIDLTVRVLRFARGDRQLVVPAVSLLALVLLQFTLGVFVIQHGKPPTLTTFHVLNAAVLLATSLVLALRLRHYSPAGQVAPEPALPHSSPLAA